MFVDLNSGDGAGTIQIRNHQMEQLWTRSRSKRTQQVLLVRTSRKMLLSKTQPVHDKKGDLGAPLLSNSITMRKVLGASSILMVQVIYGCLLYLPMKRLFCSTNQCSFNTNGVTIKAFTSSCMLLGSLCTN